MTTLSKKRSNKSPENDCSSRHSGGVLRAGGRGVAHVTLIIGIIIYFLKYHKILIRNPPILMIELTKLLYRTIVFKQIRLSKYLVCVAGWVELLCSRLDAEDRMSKLICNSRYLTFNASFLSTGTSNAMDA